MAKIERFHISRPMLSLAAALLLGNAGWATADDVPKGVIVVRAEAYNAAANQADNYKNQSEDANGRLLDVSALCGSDAINTAAALVATDQSRTWKSYMTASSTAIINLGGRISRSPMANNPNHCSIDGLTLGQIKGVWH